MPSLDIRPEDAERYVLAEERDYEALRKIYALETLSLSQEDTRLVRFIRSQLERDWRTPLLETLDVLLKTYAR